MSEEQKDYPCEYVPPQYRFENKIKSRKFIFASVTFIINAALAMMGYIPATIYEGVATVIILSYLASNVAYRYVDSSGKEKDFNRPEEEVEVHEVPVKKK